MRNALIFLILLVFCGISFANEATYYAGSGDGRVTVTGKANWAVAYGADPGDTAVDDAVDAFCVSARYTTWQNTIIYLPINMTMPAGSTITAAALHVFAAEDGTDNLDDAYSYISVMQGNQGATGSLATSDYPLRSHTDGCDAGKQN